MSYSGFNEYLCEQGHYTAKFCYDDEDELCGFCHTKIKWHHSVDETNGRDENAIDETTPGPLIPNGFDDRWHADHYGNKFAVKVEKFLPGGVGIWREFNAMETTECGNHSTPDKA